MGDWGRGSAIKQGILWYLSLLGLGIGAGILALLILETGETTLFVGLLIVYGVLLTFITAILLFHRVNELISDRITQYHDQEIAKLFAQSDLKLNSEEPSQLRKIPSVTPEEAVLLSEAGYEDIDEIAQASAHDLLLAGIDSYDLATQISNEADILVETQMRWGE